MDSWLANLLTQLRSLTIARRGAIATWTTLGVTFAISLLVVGWLPDTWWRRLAIFFGKHAADDLAVLLGLALLLSFLLVHRTFAKLLRLDWPFGNDPTRR